MATTITALLVVTFCFIYAVTGMELVPTMCMEDCTAFPDGDYQSCKGCGEFVVCVNGRLYEKPCVGGYFWDDSFKQCREYSTTCVETNTCVNSCQDLDDGNYQSCLGCSVYVTCLHGSMYDNRPCPGNLVFNPDTKTCDYTSPTC